MTSNEHYLIYLKKEILIIFLDFLSKQIKIYSALGSLIPRILFALSLLEFRIFKNFVLFKNVSLTINKNQRHFMFTTHPRIQRLILGKNIFLQFLLCLMNGKLVLVI